jgi:hypothetical protein
MSVNCGTSCSSPRWYLSMEPWQNDIDGWKPKNLERNLSKCFFAHTDWPRREPRNPWWETGD